MIFAIDVGNTNIVLGAYEDDKLVMTARMATDKLKMADEYAIAISDIMKLHGCPPKKFEGAVISSVVPQLIPTLRSAIKVLLSVKTVIVGPGVKTGLNIKTDNPAILGSDMVCSSVGATLKYPMPCIVIDLGTSTTVAALDESGAFIGCSICPGVRLSLKALSENAAQLPFINLDPTDKIIGTNTIDSMKSGILFGHAAMLDGMIERYKEILGENTYVVATGGLAPAIISNCKSEITVDDNLILDGLLSIYKRNS